MDADREVQAMVKSLTSARLTTCAAVGYTNPNADTRIVGPGWNTCRAWTSARATDPKIRKTTPDALYEQWILGTIAAAAIARAPTRYDGTRDHRALIAMDEHCAACPDETLGFGAGAVVKQHMAAWRRPPQ
jgi:hypothetical protein